MKTVILLALGSLMILTVSAESGDAEVDIDISEACDASIQDFGSPGIGPGDHTQIGINDIGFFDGIVSNTGNQYAEVEHELRVWGNLTAPDDENQTERSQYIHAEEVIDEEFQLVDLSPQEPTINDTNETEENQTDIEQDLDWNIVEEEWEQDDDPENYTYYNWTDELHTETTFEPLEEENQTSINQFYREFQANYPAGDYIGELVIDYECENSEQGIDSQNTTFEIVDLEGEGVIPDDVGEDDEVDQEVETDAEEPDEAETEFEQDANETTEDAETREGDLEDFPGVTEVPEPEPDPDPLPWLGLEQHPHNITYTAEREGFTEMGIEVENTGDANLEQIEVDPRVDDEDWNFEVGEIDSLDVGERENTSVFVEPTDEVEPGFYEIPVYASLPERDLDLEYLSVEVLPDLAPGQIDVLEAPTSLSFVIGTENEVPIVVENPGEEELTGVEADLRDHDECGESSVAELGDLDPGDQASGVIEFEAADSPEDCEARLVVSSQEGNYAFADVDISIVEEEVIVPEEFRVPLVASLWTLLLLAYSVSYRKFDLLEQPALKMPLLLLIVGEVFIIVYLSSVYYGVLPQEMLPF